MFPFEPFSDDELYEILIPLQEKGEFTYYHDIHWEIHRQGYIEPFSYFSDDVGNQIPSDEWRISRKTEVFIKEYEKRIAQEELEEKRFKRKEIREWATLAIAILAFILSVWSLSWQYSEWKQSKTLGQSSATTTTAADVQSSNP